MLTTEKFPDMSDIIEVKEIRTGGLVDMSGQSKVKPYTEIFNRSNRAISASPTQVILLQETFCVAVGVIQEAQFRFSHR